MLLNFLENLLWCKGHSVHIIAGSYFNAFGRSEHYLYCTFNGVVSVDHWKWSIFFEVAFVILIKYGFVENVHSIIGSTSSRWWSVSNEARISDTPNIYTELSAVILTPQLTCFFCDPVNRRWIHYSFLRSLLGTVASECSNGTWPEELLNFFIFGSFQTVEQGSHV